MPRQRSVRWSPAVVVLGLCLAVQLWIRLFSGRTGQDKFVLAVIAGFFTALLLLVWLLFLSRLRWRTRLLTFGGLVSLGFLVSWSVEIRGVSGNLVPVLGWRWPGSGPSVAMPGSGAAAGMALSSVHDYPRFLGLAGDATVSGLRLARAGGSTPSTWRAAAASGAATSWASTARARPLRPRPGDPGRGPVAGPEREGSRDLVESTPEEHRELGRLQVLAGKSWNPPALAGSRLLVRNDREAAAYELPLASD